MRFNPQLLRQLKSPLLIIDAGGLVMLANDAALALLGQPRALVEQHHVLAQRWQLIDGADAPIHSDAHPLLTATASPARVFIAREDGSRCAVEIEAAQIDGVFAASLRDVSALIDAQQLMEQQRAALLHELHDAERLRSIGLLAGGIAHDFNNLLAGVIGNTSFLQEDLAGQEAPLRLLDDIMLAATQMMELTNHLLAYSGKSNKNSKTIDVFNAIRETYHVIRLSIPTGCDFVMEPPELPLWVEADPGHLRQILLNIIVNAADAVRDSANGLIRLHMSALPALPGRPLDGSHPRGMAHIVISDNGHGMDADTLAHIFDPFFTTKSTGRGLGLSAVQGFVRTMGGELDVVSSRGEGTSFHLYLPLSIPPDQSAAHLAHSQEAPLRGVVLVVDDEQLVQNVCQRTLEREGLVVAVASHGEEALRWLARAEHLPDLVLLDVIMPGIDGVALLDTIRRSAPSLPVIIMSGYTEQSFEMRQLDDPAVSFLQKPFYPKDLKEAVSKIFEAVK